MNEFSAAIAAFSAGQVGFAQLEATLARALSADPTIAPAAFAEIDRVYKAGLLPLQVYVGLKNLIAQTGAASQWPHAITTSNSLPARGEPVQMRGDLSRPEGATVFAAHRPATLGPGAVLKGRFVLENEIGRGGMGVVFRAKDLRKEEAQDRDPYVAIKILNDEFRTHPESLKTLQREARKSQQLAHPNIVNVFDFDRDGGTVYMTMEFLEGESLDAIIKHPRFDGMSLAGAYPLIKGLGNALAYAHDKGIVHSDFKPGNCFRTKSGAIKVFDFGIARAAQAGADGDVTRFDAGSLGALTPAYASCDMTAGEPPDPRDDVYAFGCVIYEMLTGKHPFGRKSAIDAQRSKLAAPRIAQLSRGQWRTLEKSLAFRRADRTPAVREVVDGLAEQPRSRAAPRVMVGAAAVVVLSIAAYFGAGVWHQRQDDRLVAALSSGADARVIPALQSLAALDSTRRSRALNDVAAPLLAWYERRINAAADKDRGPYDFRRAADIAAEAKRWYPDSARIEDLRRQKEQDAAALVKALETRFTAAVAAGRLTADPRQDDVLDVIDVLREVDPDNRLLDRGRLVGEYTRRASEALNANDSARAKDLVGAGLARFPGEASLLDLRAKLAQEPRRERPTRPSLAADAGPVSASASTPTPPSSSASPSVSADVARRARVDGVKRAFETFVEAGDVPGSKAARERLVDELPANDPYVTEAAQRLAELLLKVANQRFGEENFKAAQRAADDGLAVWPDSAALAALSALSRDADTLRTRIAGGVPGDASRDSALREQIRANAGARFATLDRTLIATAEARIAENPQDRAYVAYVTSVFERAFGGSAQAPASAGSFVAPVLSGLPASAPAAASAVPPTARPSTTAADAAAPTPLARIAPDYPPRALRLGLEGWVKLRFTITATGTVVDAIVIDADPKMIFDEAALQALSRWRYSPRVESGVAVARPGVQTIIRFTLEH